MSALWAATDLTEPGPRPAAPAVRRPRLRAVPDAPARMARVPFMAVLITLFGLGMGGLLMLNTTLQNQAFAASRLNTQARELTYNQAELEGQIAQLDAPQELARRASALGMRPNPYPAFVQLPSGKVIGTPSRVTGKEADVLVVKTTAELAKEKAAAATKKAAAAAKKQADATAKAAAARKKQLQAEQAAQTSAAQADAQRKAAAAQQKAAAEKTAKTTKGNR